MLSAVMEDYIKAIYAIEKETGDRVSTSALADYLDVTPPTVSSMIKKLEERGLVDREEYKGVTLTDEGEVVALEILRHHRLLESFLTEALDYDWADVHDEADRLEHHVSDELRTASPRRWAIPSPIRTATPSRPANSNCRRPTTPSGSRRRTRVIVSSSDASATRGTRSSATSPTPGSSRTSRWKWSTWRRSGW
jgi:Mn-dependent DtxR family transcriptional regulator